MVSCPDLCSVPHVLVSWGKLIKAIVLDIFKDVHKVLGSLGEPFHITMNPNVQGWRSGESTCLPPMWPGSIPRFGIICGLSLLVFYSAGRRFSLGTPGFPSPQRPTFDLVCVNCDLPNVVVSRTRQRNVKWNTLDKKG